MAMAKTVRFLQERDDLHMGLAFLGAHDLLPMLDRLAVCLLDGREVGGRAFDLFRVAQSAASTNGAGEKSSGKWVMALMTG